jgi:hypothetical protein
MASTTFIDNQTVIVASWLNDVNAYTYNGTSLSGILNGSTLALQTGGLNAVNIDASQNVSIGKLAITTSVSFPAGTSVTFPSGGLTFNDGSIQTTAAYMGANNCLFENNMTITANYSITAGRSASSVGPITINNGVTVTVPSGSNWVIH